MTFSFKRPTDPVATYSIFGKLPCRADFVRIHASHPAASELDTLLAGSMALLTTPDSLARYRSMPAAFFMLRSRDRQWLSLGAVQPSNDQSGRDYPLLAALHLPAVTDMPPMATMLLACELFFSGLQTQLGNARDNAVEMLACQQYLAAQVAFGATSREDMTLATQVLTHYLQHTPCSQLSRLTGGGLDKTLLAFVFHSQLQQKFRHGLAAQTYLLPLPPHDGEDMLVAASWLALYTAAATPAGATELQCLLLSRPDGRFLALQPSAPDAHIMAQCWGAPLPARLVVNPGEDTPPWQQHPSFAEAAYILGKRLHDPDFTLAQLRDLIAALASGMH